MSTMKALSLIIFAGLVLASCGSKPETVEDGINAIIKLYKTGDFKKLVNERYAEIHKAKSEKEVNKIIEMYTKRFKNVKYLNQAIGAYTKALLIKPIMTTNENSQISETGQVATFKGDKFRIKLYMLKSGKWGFHR